MKSIIIAGLLLGAAHGAAQAGPYVNVEANSGFFGTDYTGTVTDAHVGIEGDNWYVQAGPSFIQPDGRDGDVEISGKVGGSVPVGAVDIYGELAGVTGDTNSYGAKAGLKWAF